MGPVALSLRPTLRRLESLRERAETFAEAEVALSAIGPSCWKVRLDKAHNNLAVMVGVVESQTACHMYQQAAEVAARKKAAVARAAEEAEAAAREVEAKREAEELRKQLRADRRCRCCNGSRRRRWETTMVSAPSCALSDATAPQTLSWNGATTRWNATDLSTP